jgi:predicted protein tyrosine phosphatase
MIYVCSLHEMPEHVRTLRPGYLVSLVQPEFQPPTPSGVRADRHLRVAVDDVSEPGYGAVVPEEDHVRELLAFLQRWPGDEALLLHCYAGVSRSTAAALIALSLEDDGREMEAARILRAAAPHALPNTRIVELADRLLGRGGRLVAAREAMGPAALVFEGPLVELPLLR